MDLSELGQRIRRAREELGLSQEDLAHRVSKDQAAISEYENGKRRVSVTELPVFAEVLRVPITYFYGEEADTNVSDRALLAEFHRIPEHSKQGAITILRTLADLLNKR